jgi:16S rRNA (uracil1498-N3)-methyltransferase
MRVMLEQRKPIVRRVRIAPGGQPGEQVILPPAEAHYVSRVLRLRVGDEIKAFDGVNCEYDLRLTEVARQTVTGHVVRVWATPAVSYTPMVLGQAMPKGPKMDLIVAKCSELGLTTLVPLYTDRTVRRHISQRDDEKLGRWQRIAEAAAKQCGRQTLLEIRHPMTLDRFCVDYQTAPLKFICWAQESQQSLRQIVEQWNGRHPVVALVGPEGGWSDQEIAVAQAHGFLAAHLGPLTLRTETAAIVATSLVRYQLGDFELKEMHHENDSTSAD